MNKYRKMIGPGEEAWFELTVQRGDGWGEEERNTGKSNRVKLR